MALDVRERTRYCSRCGVDCTHKSRYRDRRGRYLCGACHELLLRKREARPAKAARPRREVNQADATRRFHAARLAALEQAARERAPASDPRRSSCPRCARRIPRNARTCPSCEDRLGPEGASSATRPERDDATEKASFRALTFRMVCLTVGLAVVGRLVWAAIQWNG